MGRQRHRHDAQPAGLRAEIVEVVLALLNPAATYLNGAVIPVDGGLTAGSSLVPISPRR